MAVDKINPQMEKKHTVIDFFSRSARHWETIYEAEEGKARCYKTYSMVKRKDTLIEYLQRHAGPRSLRVLDAGCGPGVVLEEVLARGHSGTGVDISATMVGEANRRIARFADRAAPCQQGDIEALPFESGSFDVIVSLGVLMYLTSDDNALDEISRVVKPGGVVLINVPNVMRLNILFDPYYVYRGARYVWQRLIGKRIGRTGTLAPEDLHTNRNFTNRQYLFGGLNKLLGRHNLAVRAITGTDFSPLTFWGKHIFAAETNIAISERLCRTARRKGFGWLHALASQWVIYSVRS